LNQQSDQSEGIDEQGEFESASERVERGESLFPDVESDTESRKGWEQETGTKCSFVARASKQGNEAQKAYEKKSDSRTDTRGRKPGQ